MQPLVMDSLKQWIYNKQLMIGFLLFNYFEYCYNVPRASWLSGNSDSNPRGKVPSSYVAKKKQ